MADLFQHCLYGFYIALTHVKSQIIAGKNLSQLFHKKTVVSAGLFFENLKYVVPQIIMIIAVI